MISACSRRQSQFFMGKSGSVENNPATKRSLNVMITCSAALQQWIPSGESRKWITFDCSDFWKTDEASFYSLMFLGLSPLIRRCSFSSLNN